MKCNSIFVSVGARGARGAGVRENGNAKCVVFFQHVGLNLHTFVELAWILLNPNEWSDIKNLFGRRQLSSISEQQKKARICCACSCSATIQSFEMYTDFILTNRYHIIRNESAQNLYDFDCKRLRYVLLSQWICSRQILYFRVGIQFVWTYSGWESVKIWNVYG